MDSGLRYYIVPLGDRMVHDIANCCTKWVKTHTFTAFMTHDFYFSLLRTYDVLHPGTVKVLNPTDKMKNITANVDLQPI